MTQNQWALLRLINETPLTRFGLNAALRMDFKCLLLSPLLTFNICLLQGWTLKRKTHHNPHLSLNLEKTWMGWSGPRYFVQSITKHVFSWWTSWQPERAGEERLLEGQRRTMGESFLFFISDLHPFWLCLFFLKLLDLFLWFHHVNCSQPFLKYYSSAASVLNVGGRQNRNTRTAWNLLIIYLATARMCGSSNCRVICQHDLPPLLPAVRTLTHRRHKWRNPHVLFALQHL